MIGTFPGCLVHELPVEADLDLVIGLRGPFAVLRLRPSPETHTKTNLRRRPCPGVEYRVDPGLDPAGGFGIPAFRLPQRFGEGIGEGVRLLKPPLPLQTVESDLRCERALVRYRESCPVPLLLGVIPTRAETNHHPVPLEVIPGQERRRVSDLVRIRDPVQSMPGIRVREIEHIAVEARVRIEIGILTAERLTHEENPITRAENAVVPVFNPQGDRFAEVSKTDLRRRHRAGESGFFESFVGRLVDTDVLDVDLENRRGLGRRSLPGHQTKGGGEQQNARGHSLHNLRSIPVHWTRLRPAGSISRSVRVVRPGAQLLASRTGVFSTPLRNVPVMSDTNRDFICALARACFAGGSLTRVRSSAPRVR